MVGQLGHNDLVSNNGYHVWTTFGLELVTLLEEVIISLISISSQ